MFEFKLGLDYNATYKKHSHMATSYKEMRKCSLDGPEDNNSNFYGLFSCNLQSLPFSQSTSISINSQSTDESMRVICKDGECVRTSDKLEGLEKEYNYLISQNENQDTNHFTILNENVRTLINKRRNKNQLEKTVPKFKDKLDNNLCQEVSIVDLTHILDNPAPNFFPINKNTKKTVSNNYQWIHQQSPELKPIGNEANLEDQCLPHDHIIPDKFRKKKLPHLDKKMRTGYIKFFDDTNHFGFMNLTTEPFGEVFIFGKEFEKSNIDPKIISFASNNPQVIFKFRVMYYMGKHGESKKAVNICLSNC